MITVGLDFGTHQTKVCVEEKDRLETRYSFVTFKDASALDNGLFRTKQQTLCRFMLCSLYA